MYVTDQRVCSFCAVTCSRLVMAPRVAGSVDDAAVTGQQVPINKLLELLRPPLQEHLAWRYVSCACDKPLCLVYFIFFCFSHLFLLLYQSFFNGESQSGYQWIGRRFRNTCCRIMPLVMVHFSLLLSLLFFFFFLFWPRRLISLRPLCRRLFHLNLRCRGISRHRLRVDTLLCRVLDCDVAL